MMKISNKLKYLSKFIKTILAFLLFIPNFTIASSLKNNFQDNCRNHTLAPVSESIMKRVEIRDLIVNAYQNNLISTPTLDRTYLMGFNHLDLKSDSLKKSNVENIDYSMFFEKKIEATDTVKLIAIENYPMGIVLISENGEKKDQYLFTGITTDTGKKLEKIVTQTAVDNYFKMVEHQKIPLKQKYLVAISELEDNPDGVSMAGGKGASLGELEKAMIRISKKMGENLSGVQGCVLSVAALRHFFNSNPEMKKEVQRLVYEVDTQNATEREETANKIADMIRGKNPDFPVKIPNDLKEILEVYYHSLSMWMWLKGLGISSTDLIFDLAIAIRSSGTAEDAKVDVPWFKNSTGSEAGIGETSLGVRGIINTEEKTQRGWSSLLTDRAFAYREFQALISCAGEIGEDNYNYIIQKMKVREDEARKRGDIDYADRLKAGYNQLEEHSNMGYKRLVEFIESEIAMLDDSSVDSIRTKQRLQDIIDSYKRSANEVMNLDKLGQALVILRQLDSNCSGTSFTCITNTGFTGSHLKFEWDEELGRVMALELDIANQQGEAVVSSLTNPDHYELVRVRKENPSKDDPDPYQWIITSKILGSKEVQVVLKDRLFTSEDNKKNQLTTDDGLSGALDMILSADNDTNKNLVLELTRSINLSLSGLSAQILLEKNTPWLYKELYSGDAKRLTEAERAEKIDEVLANSFRDHDKVKDLSEKDFAKLTSSLQKISEILKTSSNNSKLGLSEVKAKLFNKEKNNDKTRQFLAIMSKIWKKEVLQDVDILFLREVNMTPLQANKVAMMAHPEWNDRNTVAVATTKVVQNNFVLADESIKKIATYLAGIGEHYALKHGKLDKRDLEWAIELGQDGTIDMKGIGIQGIKRKGQGVFSPLQARPVTSKIVDGSPFVQLQSTEVDQNYIKANSIEPIAKGVKGVGAAVGDYLYFVDDERPLGEQENEIRELVATGKKVVAVIEFGGPQHDPIMKASNGGVVTSQGGGTSHVAIFCREQGIVAVTGLGSDHTGKSRVEILKELQESEGDNFKITIDANNGLIYGEEIKINNIFTEIKVPYLPILKNTKVGLILGSPVKAQKLSKLADYVSGYGISLARGEFIAEQMGLHPKVARCFGIMQILEKSAYYESIKNKLERFKEKDLEDINIFLNENPYLSDKFESLRIEGVLPQNLPNNFGPHMNMYEKYLLKKELAEMELFEEINKSIQLSDEDIDDLAKYVSWKAEYPDEYQQMLELTRGYDNPESYVSLAMSGPQSAIALSLGLKQVNQNRAFDNKPNEDDSKGAKVFTPKIWEGNNLTPSQKKNQFNNPLISLRGISLLNRQKEYDLLLKGLFMSVKNGVKNQGLMNVFIRTPREIRLFLEKIEKMAKEFGVMPSEIGLMTEVPSNYFYAAEMTQLLNAFYARNHKKFGLKKVYFSFGTNDLTNLSGGTDRDDPKIQNFVIKDTWVIDANENELQRLPKEARELIEKNKSKKGMRAIPLADESSTVLKRIMEKIIAEAKNPNNAAYLVVLETAKILNKHPLNVTIEDIKEVGLYGVFVGLCGQAIVKGIEGGTIAETQELIFLLDSFGTDDKNYAQAAMTAFDAEQRFAEISNKVELSEIENVNLFDTPDKGALTGSIVRISKKEDIASTKLAHLKPDEQKLALLENPMNGTKVATKIVIIDGPLGNERDFSELVDEKTGETIQKATSWEDLRYSTAIFIDQTYWIKDGKLDDKKMKEDLSIIFDNDKLKHRVKGIGSFTKDKFMDEQVVAFSYEDKKVYRGENAKVNYLTPEHKPLLIPEISVDEVQQVEGISFSTAEVLAKNKVHPLKIWNDNATTAEADFTREFMNAFKAKVKDKNQKVLWKAETLDRAQLWDKEYGEKMEETLNENPKLGIRDAARLLNDFSGINHAQLKAIKKLLDEGYQINYQITNLKGTRSKEVLAASLLVIEKLGLREYKNFKVGVNIAHLTDVVQVDEYLDWIDYVHVDYKELAFNLLALDPKAQETIKYGVIKNDEVLAVMPRPLKLILKAIKDKNKFLFIDSKNELNDLKEIVKLDKYQKNQKRAAKVFQEIGFSLMNENKDMAEKFLDMALKFSTFTYRPIYDKENLTSLRYYLVNEKHSFNIKEFPDVLVFLKQEMNREVSQEEIDEIQNQVPKTYELKSISNLMIKSLDNIRKAKESQISA